MTKNIASDNSIIFINLLNADIKICQIKDRVNSLIHIANRHNLEYVAEKTLSQFKLICYRAKVGNNTVWTIQTSHNISLN
jgi:hypothetical protein